MYARLNIEIERFYNYTKPSRFETIARKHLIEQVREHVRKGLRDYVVEVFGSERTGIALATSDIDFRLLRQSTMESPEKAKLPPTPNERKQASHALYQLLHHLNTRHKNLYMLTALRHARYPLISAQDQQSGLDIQIVLSNDTSVSRVIMQGYMEEYPYLCQLYYVVKTIFDVRGLSDVFRGGFGSYSLFMMLVASLKHAPHPRKDAAGGLINFLKFWRDFDTRKQGISIEPALLFDKAEEQIATDTVKQKLRRGVAKPLPEYMLALRDPADETNDLGRKGIAIKHVQVTFRDLSAQLEFDTRVNTRPSLIGYLVGSSYKNDHARRQKLHKYGERLLEQMQRSMAAKAKAVREAENLELMESEKRVALEKQLEEEDAKQRLAREERDREWQRSADERNERTRKEAQRSAVLEHGEAMASILGMPAVEEEVHGKEDSAAQGQEES
jgi:non-canonical poly(A) RNA polymerase PAPD5/7